MHEVQVKITLTFPPPALHSPLLLGVLETARVLLRMETLAARLEDWEMDAFGAGSLGQTGGLVSGLIEGYARDVGLGLRVGGGGGGGGGGVGSGEKEREEIEEELSELSWKIGRLTEMFLSEELQVRAKRRKLR